MDDMIKDTFLCINMIKLRSHFFRGFNEEDVRLDLALNERAQNIPIFICDDDDCHLFQEVSTKAPTHYDPLKKC